MKWIHRMRKLVQILPWLASLTHRCRSLETGSDSPLACLPHSQVQKFNSLVSKLAAPRVRSLVWTWEADLQFASESQ